MVSVGGLRKANADESAADIAACLVGVDFKDTRRWLNPLQEISLARAGRSGRAVWT
jgi:hypothetical protein